MKIVKLIYVLYKIKLLSPIHFFWLIVCLIRSGTNLMTLLDIAAKSYTNRVAITDDDATVTYKELRDHSYQFAACLYESFPVQRGSKVALLCRNHIPMIQAIFAVSRIGADVCLLNTEMGEKQIKKWLEEERYDALIYDIEFQSVIQRSNFKGVTITRNQIGERSQIMRLPRASSGKIVLHTGGTTGKPKQAGHKPSLFHYLNPFIALINRLHLLDYQIAYIGTPIFHGYGIAVLLLFIPLGKKIILTTHFDAEKSCQLIQKQQVEFVTVVPTMLERMLSFRAEDLKTLRCIASGGAPLQPRLVEKTTRQIGSVLYNLYGTSEAGLTSIATPADLAYSPLTVGKKIPGLQVKILHKQENVRQGQSGEIVVKNSWSIRNQHNSWIKTGDVGYLDENGYIFLSGRSDEMILSGGENVYPMDIEYILLEHPDIEDAAVIGVPNQEYGEILKAYIQTSKLTTQEVAEWLKPRIARYQMPKEIEIVTKIPYTAVGKKDKKKLRGAGSREHT